MLLSSVNFSSCLFTSSAARVFASNVAGCSARRIQSQVSGIMILSRFRLVATGIVNVSLSASIISTYPSCCSLSPIRTVSYTHLDVYKRQICEAGTLFNKMKTETKSGHITALRELIPMLEGTYSPVAYTHLCFWTKRRMHWIPLMSKK